jgi:hypothetical protein
VLAIFLAVVLLAAALKLLGTGDGPPADGTIGGILGGDQTMPLAASGNPAGVGGPADAADESRIVEVAVSRSAAFEPATVEMSGGDVVTSEVANTIARFRLSALVLHGCPERQTRHDPGPSPHRASHLEPTPQCGDPVNQAAQARTGSRVRAAPAVVGDLDPELIAI